MNNSELIDAMAPDAGISKAALKDALCTLLGRVRKPLKDTEPDFQLHMGT